MSLLEVDMDVDAHAQPKERLRRGIQTVVLSGQSFEVTDVFWDYWYLAAERQRMFQNRVAGVETRLTADPILAAHRFTNAYRASDRVSQYLLQRVIYDDERSALDTIFRTLLFKIFNKVETWEHLLLSVGEPSVERFDRQAYELALDERYYSGQRLYSAAYIMPSPQFGRTRKHANHLELIESLVENGTLDRLAEAHSLAGLYDLLLEVPSFGPFLAFQYAIDLNYGGHFNFSEMDFVVAGPGARRGIQKCFVDTAGLSSEDLIRAVAEAAPSILTSEQPDFHDLWGRPLQLIDCQNLFCEVDKYARVARPEFNSTNGPVRIKQNYRANVDELSLGYPPKWKLPYSAASPALVRRPLSNIPTVW